MKKLFLILLVGAVVLMGYDRLSEQDWWPLLGTESTEIAPDQTLVVRGVEVRDLDGRVAWRGDVNLAPHLARIERGERDPHRNDGNVFHNREGLLPQRPRGHYREYVIRTPGINHAGPQRLVLGSDGEIFYTSDHYRSFQRLR